MLILWIEWFFTEDNLPRTFEHFSSVICKCLKGLTKHGIWHCWRDPRSYYMGHSLTRVMSSRRPVQRINGRRKGCPFISAVFLLGADDMCTEDFSAPTFTFENSVRDQAAFMQNAFDTPGNGTRHTFFESFDTVITGSVPNVRRRNSGMDQAHSMETKLTLRNEILLNDNPEFPFTQETDNKSEFPPVPLKDSQFSDH